MAGIVEVRIPKYPECWENCGSCGAGAVTIDDIRVLPGDSVARDDVILVLETAKVALEIPSPADGTVVELFVGPGEEVAEGQLILTLQSD